MPTISQEELDRLRAGSTGTSGPLGAPEGEGLAARSIADYLRGAGPLSGGGGGGGGGGLSYGNTASNVPDFRSLAAARAGARDAGASVAELQAVDAQQRAQNRQSTNPFGLNNRQNDALSLAWQSSPDRVALEATNKERAAQGLPTLNSTYGQNYYHTNEDGSRDYNYSKEGTYRGETPSQFATGDPNNPYAAHFNNDTGQWEAGDLSLMQTFKDIGSGFKDAYGNIRETIPQIGGEVVSGFKDLYGSLTGQKQAQAAEVAKQQAAQQASSQAAAVQAAQAQTAAHQAQAAQVAAQDNRDRQSSGSQSLAAATRAQLGKTNAFSAANKATTKGAASDYGGFNMGGPISLNYGGVAKTNLKEEQIQQQQRAANAPQIASPGGGGGLKEQLSKKLIGSLVGSATGGLGSMLGGLFNDGGMVGHRMAGGRFMSGVEHKGSGGAVTGMSPDTFINGKIASKHYPTPAGASNQPVHLNMGGPLAGNPNGYNEGGAASETPIKKVMDEQKLAQQAKAFDLEQGRKQEAHDMAMKQKKQAFSEAQKMKKASATTKMKPKAPLGAA